MEKYEKDETKSKKTGLKESMQSCFSMVSKWFKTPIIRNAIIISGLFALVIHVLYSIPAPVGFFVHKWEAGDILTYVSTIALSLLAIWQNQRFKEENDNAQAMMEKQNSDAQKRLERIISESNEQNFVTRIIDFETQYLMRLEKAGLEVLDYSQTYAMVDAIQKAVKSGEDTLVTDIYTRFNQAYTHLMTTYFSGMMVVNIDITPMINSFKELHTITSNVITEYHKTDKFDTAFVNTHLDVRKKALRALNLFLDKRRKVLHQVLTGDLSLNDVKLLYSDYGESGSN